MNPVMARTLASLAASAAWMAGAAPAIEVDSSMKDEISVAKRADSVGTSTPRAVIEARPVRASTMVALIEQASAAALKPCADGPALTIVASDLLSHDFVGESTTRLSGPGLYVSVSQRGTRGSGTGSIAPYVSIHLRVSGGGLRKPQEFDITESERVEITRVETLEFIESSPAEIERAVMSYAARVVEQHLRKELIADCGAG